MEYSINPWAVLAAAVSTMIVGSLWYGPLFGKMWMKLSGLTRESMKSMPLTAPQAMGLGLVTALMTAYVLAHIADAFMVFDTTSAFQMAFWLWFGLAVPFTAGAWLWEGKSFKLFVLNAAHWLVSLTAVSVILAYWR
jgi:hypothetical protein